MVSFGALSILLTCQKTASTSTPGAAVCVDWFLSQVRVRAWKQCPRLSLGFQRDDTLPYRSCPFVWGMTICTLLALFLPKLHPEEFHLWKLLHTSLKIVRGRPLCLRFRVGMTFHLYVRGVCATWHESVALSASSRSQILGHLLLVSYLWN